VGYPETVHVPTFWWEIGERTDAGTMLARVDQRKKMKGENKETSGSQRRGISGAEKGDSVLMVHWLFVAARSAVVWGRLGLRSSADDRD